MTFEEFKQHQEVFSKMDTPEKIALLQQQYERYLLLIEDNNFFEPVTNIDDEKELISIYEEQLHAILNFDPMEGDRLYFLVKPSFEAEHLLIMEKLDNAYALRHCTLKTSFWLGFYDNPALATAETIISEGILSKTPGDRIFKLVDDSIKAAKKPSGKWAVIDGVGYRVSKIVGDQRIDVMKNSSREDTQPGRIISLLETVIKLTQPNPGADVERELALKLELLNGGE
jgi:hypothetical protein